LARTNPHEWQTLKQRLEQFGEKSELFNEISVRSLGNSDGDPFQLQIRKFGNRRKGRPRNLIDVGYGVSQVLPTLTEILRNNGPSTFLLQQPEVHLHPSVQAALGTLFCQVAAGGRQIVVETHSDYLIDRVRMDVRDQTTDLKPEDVSILYFEPADLDVKIHSIRLDEMGNVLDAPHSYSQFFMEEVNRSIGLTKPNVRDSR
jgi:predicted ATPase